LAPVGQAAGDAPAAGGRLDVDVVGQGAAPGVDPPRPASVAGQGGPDPGGHLAVVDVAQLVEDVQMKDLPCPGPVVKGTARVGVGQDGDGAGRAGRQHVDAGAED